MEPSPTSSPPPSLSRRRAKTKPALLQAGLKLLAERPVDSLSIDEIVEAANVAKGSFFYHFADKHSFAREIAAGVRVEVEATVSEINRGVTDPALRVARGMAQFVVFALNQPEKASLVLSADWRSIDPRHSLNAGLRADLELGVNSGRFDCRDIDAAMLNLIGAANVLIGRVLFDKPDSADARRLYVSVLAFAYRGLGLGLQVRQLL